MNELAACVGLDRITFTRLFQAETGVSPSTYLKRAQIVRAIELLETTDSPTHRVACASAFGSRITFFRAFKRLTGVTPDGYRSCRTEGRNKM